MTKYSEKLKDPRWQKMRLKILERDEWHCQICFDDKSTLHVHHKYYESGKEPWEYDQDVLVTLCEYCHDEETHVRPTYEKLLLQNLRKHFYSDQIRELSDAFGRFQLFHVHDLCSRILHYLITHDDILYEMYEKKWDEMLQELKDKKKEKND